MAYAGTHHPTLPTGGLAARIAAWRRAHAAYREKRAIYLRTLRELQSYRPHELNDLRIHPADFERLAREQAGFA
jgi:hypothetical protein